VFAPSSIFFILRSGDGGGESGGVSGGVGRPAA